MMAIASTGASAAIDLRKFYRGQRTPVSTELKPPSSVINFATDASHRHEAVC